MFIKQLNFFFDFQFFLTSFFRTFNFKSIYISFLEEYLNIFPYSLLLLIIQTKVTDIMLTGGLNTNKFINPIYIKQTIIIQMNNPIEIFITISILK